MEAKKSTFSGTFSGSHIKAFPTVDETLIITKPLFESELLQANTVGFQRTHGGRKGGKTSSC